MAEQLYYQAHVFVCTNRRPDGHKDGCCASKGSEQLRNYMKKKAKELGIGAVAPASEGEQRTKMPAGAEQSRPQNIRINGAGCLDRCELGPVLVIYPEGVWYAPKNESDVDEILTVHLQQGKRVERLMLANDR